MIVHKFQHAESGDTAEIIAINHQMIRIRWEDGIEDDYHITRINQLVAQGAWKIEN